MKNKQNGLPQRYLPFSSFQLNMRKWMSQKGPDLFQRTKPLTQYISQQREAHIWLYNRTLLTGVNVQVLAMDQNSNFFHGINFASNDYLGLAQSQLAKQYAIKVASQMGVNSAGSPVAFGATKYFRQLKQQLADFWNFKHLLIYSAGWLAGFGVIKALIKQTDYIVMDRLAHNCLQQGAKASTKNIIRTQHLSNVEMELALKKIRQNNNECAILVITQGLFSMDSDTCDLKQLQKITKRYNAFFLLDCAHDFGCMGVEGRGCMQIQKLQDHSNMIFMGTGSKCLSTNIGFIACNQQSVIEYLKITSTSYMFTNAINPIQAATSLANVRILASTEGRRKREKVIENYWYMRKGLEAKGNVVLGQPCPILPLFIGNQHKCRLISRLMMDRGFHVNGIEYPVVTQGQARLRINLMPQHTKQHIQSFIQTFQIVKVKAQQIYQKSLNDYKAYKQSIQRSKL